MKGRTVNGTFASVATAPTKPGLIVPVGGSHAQMIVDVPAGRTASLAITQRADKVRLWPAPTGGTAIAATGTTIVGGSAQTFWIEAFAPSASLADIAFTLTVTGTGVQDSITMTSLEVLVDRINFKDDGNIDIRIDGTTDIRNGGRRFWSWRWGWPTGRRTVPPW